MEIARSGRLFSGVDDPAELVLFDSLGDDLDYGVANALVMKLISQCQPSSVTRVSVAGEWPDFDVTQNCVTHSIELDELTHKQPLWNWMNASYLSLSTTHIIILTTFKYLVNKFQVHGLVRMLNDARVENRKVLFTAFMHSIDFDRTTCLALRSVATSIVEVKQVSGDASRMMHHHNQFQVWNNLSIRVLRAKSSGRVNVDCMSAIFDSHSNTLAEYVTVDTGVKKHSRDSGSDATRTSLQHDLPFRVALSNNERNARAAVALPYAHTNARIADSALELHPQVLQISNYAQQTSNSSSDYNSDSLDDDEGIFSEDV